MSAHPKDALEFPVRLVCWHCGEVRELLVSGPVQFGFEIAELAEAAGMKGFFDFGRGRVLVFCNDDHARQQMTKNGRFRLHQKRSDNHELEAERQADAADRMRDVTEDR